MMFYPCQQINKHYQHHQDWCQTSQKPGDIIPYYKSYHKIYKADNLICPYTKPGNLRNILPQIYKNNCNIKTISWKQLF